MVQVCNLNTQEGEGSRIEGQPELKSKTVTHIHIHTQINHKLQTSFKSFFFLLRVGEIEGKGSDRVRDSTNYKLVKYKYLARHGGQMYLILALGRSRWISMT